MACWGAMATHEDKADSTRTPRRLVGSWVKARKNRHSLSTTSDKQTEDLLFDETRRVKPAVDNRHTGRSHVGLGSSTVSLESITVTLGSITVSLGSITVTLGSITVSLGSITVTLGSVTVSLGSITVTLGSVTVSLGSITVSLGSITIRLYDTNKRSFQRPFGHPVNRQADKINTNGRR